MKNIVFQYVLFFNPDTDESDEIPTIIDEGLIIAPDSEKAKIMAARKVGPEWDALINDVEILVKPFFEYRWFSPTTTWSTGTGNSNVTLSSK